LAAGAEAQIGFDTRMDDARERACLCRRCRRHCGDENRARGGSRSGRAAACGQHGTRTGNGGEAHEGEDAFHGEVLWVEGVEAMEVAAAADAKPPPSAL